MVDTAVNCFTAFNGWRSEQLIENAKSWRWVEVFRAEIEELRKLPDLIPDLSENDLKIISKLGYPLEFRLSAKDLKKLAKKSDEEARNTLFSLTADEVDVYAKYYDPRGGLRTCWTERDEAAKQRLCKSGTGSSHPYDL